MTKRRKDDRGSAGRLRLRCADPAVSEAWVRAIRQWQIHRKWECCSSLDFRISLLTVRVGTDLDYGNGTTKWTCDHVSAAISAAVYDRTESRESLMLQKECTAAEIDGSLIKELAECSDSEAERRLTKRRNTTEEKESGSLQHTASAAQRGHEKNVPAILRFARELGQARRQPLLTENAFTPRPMVLQVTAHTIRKQDNKDCYQVRGYPDEGAELEAGRASHIEYSWSEIKQLDAACKAFDEANSAILAVELRHPPFPKDRAGLSKKSPEQRLQDLQDYAKQWMEWDSLLRQQKGFALCGIRAIRSFLVL